MTTLIENGHAVSRLCLEALRKLGLEPDPGRLYVLQLLDWALDSGEVFDNEGQIWETVVEMSDWAPAAVLKCVVGDYPLPKPNQAPEDLAYQLLQNIQSQLVEHHPGFLCPTK